MSFSPCTMPEPQGRRRGGGREWILVSTNVGRALLFIGLLSALGARSAETAAQPPPADLTELPLEALMNLDVPKVYGASKLEQAVTEAPSSVTVVPAEEMKKYGHRTLGDVLKSVQGFNISYD